VQGPNSKQKNVLKHTYKLEQKSCKEKNERKGGFKALVGLRTKFGRIGRKPK